jgi:hypothetical protein
MLKVADLRYEGEIRVRRGSEKACSWINQYVPLKVSDVETYEFVLYDVLALCGPLGAVLEEAGI